MSGTSTVTSPVTLLAQHSRQSGCVVLLGDVAVVGTAVHLARDQLHAALAARAVAAARRVDGDVGAACGLQQGGTRRDGDHDRLRVIFKLENDLSMFHSSFVSARTAAAVRSAGSEAPPAETARQLPDDTLILTCPPRDCNGGRKNRPAGRRAGERTSLLVYDNSSGTTFCVFENRHFLCKKL